MTEQKFPTWVFISAKIPFNSFSSDTIKVWLANPLGISILKFLLQTNILQFWLEANQILTFSLNFNELMRSSWVIHLWDNFYKIGSRTISSISNQFLSLIAFNTLLIKYSILLPCFPFHFHYPNEDTNVSLGSYNNFPNALTSRLHLPPNIQYIDRRVKIMTGNFSRGKFLQ